ncbi:retrovirus-related pol polyprotein from transposon TNT 1-94 [Tanacetum coccineum]
MCDKKNSVLFTDTECVVLSQNFKLTDESHVLLKVPRKDNMYSIDLKNVFPQGGLTCLFSKATLDKSNLWHWRLGHINFKTINKLLPTTFLGLQAFKTDYYVQIRCPVTILNTLDHLGKFDAKADRYSMNSKIYHSLLVQRILLMLNQPSGRRKRRFEDQRMKISESLDVLMIQIQPELEDMAYMVLLIDDEDIIIGDLHLAPQTRRMTKNSKEHVEPKNVIQALTDPSWIEAMQDELLQFKLQKVWTLVDLPYGKRAIRQNGSIETRNTREDFEDPEFPDRFIRLKIHNRRLSISWKKIDFMAMQEANCNEYCPEKEMGYIMEKATTTASSLEAKQVSGNIIRTQSMVTLTEPIPQETGQTVAKLVIEVLGRLLSDMVVRSGSAEELGINITTAELVTTASAPVATASVFVSTTEPSTPPTTTTLIEDKDLTIAQTLMKNEKKRHFARLRVEEKKRKPPTKAQKMNQMCTYLKNIARFTHNQLKNKSFDEIQKAFDKTMSWINSFVPMDLEVVEGYEKKAKSNGKKAESSEKKEISKKRACKKLSEESVKRQKLEDDAEKARLKACLEIVLEDKIQDVLDMYRLAKERFETTSTEGYDTLLWGDLITLFEPKNKYSLTQEMLSRMLSGRLEVVMSVKWLMSLSDLSNHSTKSEEMFGYIFLVKIRLLIKKLEDSEVTTAGEV